MRTKITFLILLFTTICLAGIKNADSNFTSSINVSSSYQTDTYLSFYTNQDGNAVGFHVYPTATYDHIEYKIEYDRDGGLKEVVKGNISNSGLDSEIRREWITLGVCTANGTCVYHNVEGNVDLEVVLINANEKRTLRSSIYFAQLDSSVFDLGIIDKTLN